MTEPLNLDEIRARADVVQSRHCMAEGEVAAWALATDDVPALLGEVERLRLERDVATEAKLRIVARHTVHDFGQPAPIPVCGWCHEEWPCPDFTDATTWAVGGVAS